MFDIIYWTIKSKVSQIDMKWKQYSIRNLKINENNKQIRQYKL
jgi:hypothetical protein